MAPTVQGTECPAGSGGLREGKKDMETGNRSVVVTTPRRAVSLLRTSRAKRPPPLHEGSRRTGERILLIEHNRICRRLLERIVTRLGYTVHAAGSVEEAWQEFRRTGGAFVLVLLTLDSSRERGLELLGRWFADHRARRVPVIVLGNDPSTVTSRACLRAGACCYLVEALCDGRLSDTVCALAGAGAHGNNGGPLSRTLPEATAGLLDAGTFRSLMELSPDPGFIQALLGDFRREGCASLGRMRGALRQGDAARWRDAVHGLKGSAAGLGAKALVRLCVRLEALPGETLRHSGHPAYAAVLDLFRRTLEAMVWASQSPQAPARRLGG